MSDTPPFPSATRKWHTKAQPSTSPTRPELSAKGKSILITGGGNTGIGGETARYFAQANASRIGLLGRREKPLLENKAYIEKHYPGVEVFIMSTDVTKKTEVDAAFAQFAGTGKIDVLVHSAATIGAKEPVTEADGEEYLQGIQMNVAGAFWVAQAFVRHAAPDAVAIAISSFVAHWNIGNIFSSYTVAKMACYRLWDTVAVAHPNLAIFHTQPGVVLTEMNLAVGGAKSFENIQIDDVSLPASFNVWLASPEARFLKGKFLWCNWDVDELMAKAKELEEGMKLNIALVGWPFENGI
ncbi:oxidoreductase short chain dehydrogenase reductase family protein [Rutstroemia sp. NJR-2017a BBW]|nr:oxidoreductase short chain dehydrogenase reductase family protein [Rutstroemia sp. NJR-2017a BBW]